jgi:hypothetical protein
MTRVEWGGLAEPGGKEADKKWSKGLIAVLRIRVPEDSLDFAGRNIGRVVLIEPGAEIATVVEIDGRTGSVA